MSRTNRSAFRTHIALVLAVSLLGTLFFAGLALFGARPPKVSRGVLDLAHWELQSEGTVPLNGTWEFYPRRLLGPFDFARHDVRQGRRFIEVPAVWNGYELKPGERLAGDGYATYRLVIRNLHTPGPLGLYLPEFATAYTLWVDGRVLATNGLVGTTAAATVPQYSPQSVFFRPGSTSVQVILQVANYHHSKGGFWREARLGTAVQIRRLRERQVGFTAFLVGGLLILAVYHLRLYLLRRQEASSLYFGLLCVLIAVRQGVTGETYVVELLPGLPWTILIAVDFAVHVLLPATFAAFIRSLYPEETPRALITALWVVSGFFTSALLALPVKMYSRLVPLALGLIGLELLYLSLLVLPRAVLRRREGARWVFAGTALITITGVSDMLVSRKLIDVPSLLGLGVLLFVLCQVLALSRKSSEASRQIEALNAALADDRYRVIFENTGTAMIMLEQDLSITLVNSECEEMVGYRAEELVGRSWLDFVPAEDRPGLIAHATGKRQGLPVAKTFEARLRRKDGELRDILATTSLLPGSTTAVASVIDITERKRAAEGFRYLSFHDRLTGLYNRAFLEEEAARLNTERQWPLSLIMGDVNGLKLVNDALGHLKGDELLCGISRVLATACREEDVVARWGGDEFAILLPKTHAAAAQALCERIGEACAESCLGPVPLSISLGAATKTGPGLGLSELLREAEDRMYRRKLLESRSTQSAIIASLGNALWENSHETEEHAERLRALAAEFGAALGFSASQLDELSLLATLHDIGKVGIPSAILEKPGRLTPEEWEIMKKHPEIGYRIAQASPALAGTADAIAAHHERWDGSGYPKGLAGEEIPLAARALSIVDAFDVMTHERPYKRATSVEEALVELMRSAGSQFDPELVEVFVAMVAMQRGQVPHAGEGDGRPA